MNNNLEIWDNLITNILNLKFSDEKTSPINSISIIEYFGRIHSNIHSYTQVVIYYNRDTDIINSAFLYNENKKMPDMNIGDFKRIYKNYFLEKNRELQINKILN